MEEIIDNYRQNHSLYEDFTQQMNQLITTVLQERNFSVHSVVSRVKSEASLQHKINNPQKNYVSLEDITDICGLRIITHFADEVDQIAALLEQEFTIDAAHSIDKRKMLAPDRFGYLSLHFVVSLSPKRLQLTEYRRFAGLKIEIQIRSLLQHAWAEIEHDLEYKQPVTGAETRRDFSRLAGLLEFADLEFEKLRDRLQPSPAELVTVCAPLFLPTPVNETPSFWAKAKSYLRPKLPLVPYPALPTALGAVFLAVETLSLLFTGSHLEFEWHHLSNLMAALKTDFHNA